MEIVYVYQRKRREFGRQPLLQDRQAELTIEVPSDNNYMSNYVIRNPCQTSIQCVPDMSEHEANTESFVTASKGILHKEGGWPKDVDSNDAEHILRYRKKVEKDEEYIRVVKLLGENVEHCIKQNNAIDIYEEYFPPVENDEMTVSPPNAKTLNVFRDPNEAKRSISYLSWYPESGHKVAVAYSSLDFQRQTSGNSSYESYIWDIENPKEPDQKLIPSSPLVCLKYSPKDPHILIGGCYNGLVSYWDTRKGPYAVDSSTIEKSHRDPVFSVTWASSKTGSEFFSTSTDGQVLWWDIRKLSEPTDTMLLDPERNGNYVGGTVVDFESTMFMAGSESGSVFLCNKKAKSPSERITHIYAGHHGPVYALQRNPFYPKNFLSAGDWSVKIWTEDIRAPIMSTKYQSSYLTDACWSPTRPSVFFSSKMDGTVDVWDFTFKQNDPTLTFHSLRVQEHGRLVVVGDRDGSVTLVELSESLSSVQRNEKQIFSQMLERESKREKTLEGVAREKRLKAQQAQAQKRPASGKANDENDDEFTVLMREAEGEYLTFIGNDNEKGNKK